MSTQRTGRGQGSLIAAGVADLVMQVALILVGAEIVFGEDTGDDVTVVLLILWCLIGQVYWFAGVIAVGVSVRRAPTDAPRFAAMERNVVVRVISALVTFSASIIGLIAAVELLLLRDDPAWEGWIEVVAVWAMLLAWAMFHWGFARMYHRRYRIADEKPLLFPGKEAPRLADFVYFSFTNATNFSVSDVQVLTTRMRWTVVCHTTVAFFFNALIIVLAVNTIIK